MNSVPGNHGVRFVDFFVTVLLAWNKVFKSSHHSQRFWLFVYRYWWRELLALERYIERWVL